MKHNAIISKVKVINHSGRASLGYGSLNPLKRLWEGRKWSWINLEAGKVCKAIKHSASMTELCRQMVCFDNYRALQRDWLGGGGRFTLSAITFLPAPGFIWGGGGGGLRRQDLNSASAVPYHAYILRYTGSIKCVSFTHQSWNDRHLTDICSQGTQQFTQRRDQVLYIFLCFLLTIWNTETLVSFCMSNTSTVPYHMLKDRALLSPVQFNTKF